MRTKWLYLIALAMSLGAAQMASAADMPVKAPVLPPPVATNWTGIYVNGGVGYGVWSADTTPRIPTTGAGVFGATQTQGGKGWLGVVGAGYDYQFLPNFVAGVFGDYNFSDLKGTLQDQFFLLAGETKQRSAWAVGGRLGWLVTPEALAYVNGGYTQARFSGAAMVPTIASALTGFSTPDVTTHGWFVGLGAETTVPFFGPGWFWRNEYRYASYRDETLPDTNGAVSLLSINVKPVVQTVTSQIVYKFNTGGPVYQAPTPVALASWTGFYVNGGAGYGGWVADTTTQSPTTGLCVLCVTQRQGGKGWLGIVGGGFDYQIGQILPVLPILPISPKIVVGVFGDYEFSNLKGTVQDQLPFPTSEGFTFFVGDIKQKSAWAVGGRVGWLVTPQVLSYGNGGYTQARFSGAAMVNNTLGVSTSYTTPDTTFHGWFLGGGVEAAITPNLFWRNEYRFARYDNETLTDTSFTGAIPASSINFKPVVQTVTTQLVYKFNWWR